MYTFHLNVESIIIWWNQCVTTCILKFISFAELRTNCAWKKWADPFAGGLFFGTLSFSDALVYVSVPKYRTCKLQVLSASILMHRDDFGICLKPGHNLGTTASQQIVSALHTRLKYRIPILESWESPLKRECHFLFPKTGSISNSNLKFGVSLYSWRFMWFALILRHQTLSRNLH